MPQQNVKFEISNCLCHLQMTVRKFVNVKNMDLTFNANDLKHK